METEALQNSRHYQLGKHYYDMNRYEQAKEHLREALAEAPTNPTVLYMLSYCEFELGNVEEAYELCVDVLQKGLVTEYVYQLLALILQSQKKWYEAEQALLQALALNPQEPGIIATYAYLMLQTGHVKKARLLMEEAKRLDPQDSTVLHYQFYIDLIVSNKKQQQKTLQSYVEVEDDELYKLIKIGEEAYFRDDYKTAKENLVQAFLLDPTNERIKEMLDAIDKETHIVFWPNRLVDKLGGPIGMWVVFAVILFLISYLAPFALGYFAVGWLVFAVYTWISPLVYKLVCKVRSQ
ncbi:tetratricopeptide repeat protein [Brevibacillus gelatini]